MAPRSPLRADSQPPPPSASLMAPFMEQNARNREILVLHLGDRGFMAEFTLTARAMIYAAARRYRLVLDSSGFAYRCPKGWTDYFEPFCEEYSPELEWRVVQHVKCHRFGARKEPGELESFEAVRGFRIDRLRIGALEIHGFDEMMRACLQGLFRLNRPTKDAIHRIRTGLQLPEHYVAVHIRRGDKVGDEDVFYPCELYVQQLEPLEPDSAIFVLSDDHRAVGELEHLLTRQGRANRVFSLCTEKHLGFDIRKVRNGAFFFGGTTEPVHEGCYKRYVYDETIRLLAEVSIASRSRRFVSTSRSNVGRTVRWLQERPEACVLMSASPELRRQTAALQQAAGERQPLSSR